MHFRILKDAREAQMTYQILGCRTVLIKIQKVHRNNYK